MRSDDARPTTAIVAALPREIAALVRGTRADAQLLRRGIHLYRMEGAVIVTAGMGAARAAVAVEAALAEVRVTMLISAGFAGACGPELHAGEVAEANLVVDAKTGERFATAAPAGQGYTLVTTDVVASMREKARLSAAYDAALVDMEAATVARLALAHGLGSRAIKGISDAHDFELGSLARFAGRHGSFRTAAFALHTALRPHDWARAARLGRDSSRALKALHETLREIIDNDH